MIKTAIVSACIMFGLAMLISFAVAGLIKLVFRCIRRFGGA